MNNLLNIYKEKISLKEETIGTSNNHLIDPNGIIYHVIQRTNNRNSLFTPEVARHRDALLKTQCEQNGVIPLANVIMPTHTHDLFFTDDVKKISKVIRHTNQGTTVCIRNLKQSNSTIMVFTSYPGYVVVKNREQLFYLIKYLYDNPSHLRERGDYVPYSCFDMWEKNYFKPYDKTILENLLEISTAEILKLCRTLSGEEFGKLANQRYGKDSEKFSNEMFMKDVSKGWLECNCH